MVSSSSGNIYFFSRTLFDAMSWIEVEKPRQFVVLHALVGCVGSGAKPCCRKKQSIGHPVSNLGKVGSALTIKIEGSTIK